ncbi:MAG TPA: GDP-mannose 4,6-dehydratase [Dongiaceae bacterium]|nr:GDP-mannose 4,6-dehydratase [Dongiaceae bacterium]
MKHRFLVVGSNSFSGASFIRYLLQQQDEVIGVSRSPELHPVFMPYLWQSAGLENFQFHQINLNHDLDALMALIREFRPEYVVNFAAQGMVAQSWQIPEHWYQTNVVGQVRFHDQLRKLDFLKKYVHVSTPEVYGSTDGWIRENFNFAPSTPYAVSRAACDLHLMSFFRAYQFPVVFTRAANVYGPGQLLYRIIPRAMLYARLGKKMSLHGGGHSIRSFIHIQDVSEATRKIALEADPGESFHISTPHVVSIRDLVEKIAEMTGVALSDLADIGEERLGKDQAYLLDSSRLRDELGWQDKIDLQAGLAETLKWIDDNLSDLEQLPHEYQHRE